MSSKKSNMLNRLKAKGRVKLPEGLEPSGEDEFGNDKVVISDWDVIYQAGLYITCGGVVTPNSGSGLFHLGIEITPTGVDKVAALGIMEIKNDDDLLKHSAVISCGTGLYDPNVEGNVIDSIISGYVKTGDKLEFFEFAKTFIIQATEG